MGGSVTIRRVCHQWQIADGATRSGLVEMSDYNESALAAKIFEAHPDVETVFVDGDENKRVINRNAQ